MPDILDLPCEIVGNVLRSFDHAHCLLSALLTCRHFYASYQETPGVAARILRRQISPELLPFSIAILEASKLPHPRSPVLVQALLNKLYHHHPEELGDCVTVLPTRDIMMLGRIHDVIESLAMDFLTQGWARLGHASDHGTNLAITPPESLRVCRAFYQVELCIRTFCQHPNPEADIDYKLLLVAENPPWVNEQMASVHDFLEKKFMDAAVDILAHDVDFGEVSLDYLEKGRGNYWVQCWLTKGVVWIHEFVNLDSYDAKHSMLQAREDDTYGNIPSYLGPNDEDDQPYYEPFAIYLQDTAEPLVVADSSYSALIRSIGDDSESDSDTGPCKAWSAAHIDIPRGLWHGCVDNYGRRLAAYVFWDWARIQQYNLLEEFANQTESYESSDEALDAMMRSFEERSKIWQKGGRGYWNGDDMSRIEF